VDVQECRARSLPQDRAAGSRAGSGPIHRERRRGPGACDPALIMWGKLTWAAIPIDQPIVMGASAVVAVAITGVLAWIVIKGHLPYLWKEWLTSVDHK